MRYQRLDLTGHDPDWVCRQLLIGIAGRYLDTITTWRAHPHARQGHPELVHWLGMPSREARKLHDYFLRDLCHTAIRTPEDELFDHSPTRDMPVYSEWRYQRAYVPSPTAARPDAWLTTCSSVRLTLRWTPAGCGMLLDLSAPDIARLPELEALGWTPASRLPWVTPWLRHFAVRPWQYPGLFVAHPPPATGAGLDVSWDADPSKWVVGPPLPLASSSEPAAPMITADYPPSEEPGSSATAEQGRAFVPDVAEASSAPSLRAPSSTPEIIAFLQRLTDTSAPGLDAAVLARWRAGDSRQALVEVIREFQPGIHQRTASQQITRIILPHALLGLGDDAASVTAFLLNATRDSASSRPSAVDALLNRLQFADNRGNRWTTIASVRDALLEICGLPPAG